MWFLRIIWKDILRLNSLRPAVKIPGLIVLLGLVVGGWYLGREWWAKKEYIGKGGARFVPRWEFWSVVLGIIFICYLAGVIERGLKSPDK